MGWNMRRNSQLAIAVVLMAAGSGALPAPAEAQAALVEAPQIHRPFASTTKARINGFDWMTKKTVVIPARFDIDPIRKPTQIGSGSYICSPAGFGHKSRCYAN